MSDQGVLARLRTFLLLLAAGLSAGALVDLLWAAEHTEEPIQWLPFILCGLSLAATLAALLRPQRGVLLALRGIMALMVLGSLLGVYEHVAGNIRLCPGDSPQHSRLRPLVGGPDRSQPAARSWHVGRRCPGRPGGDVLSSGAGKELGRLST